MVTVENKYISCPHSFCQPSPTPPLKGRGILEFDYREYFNWFSLSFRERPRAAHDLLFCCQLFALVFCCCCCYLSGLREVYLKLITAAAALGVAFWAGQIGDCDCFPWTGTLRSSGESKAATPLPSWTSPEGSGRCLVPLVFLVFWFLFIYEGFEFVLVSIELFFEGFS